MLALPGCSFSLFGPPAPTSFLPSAPAGNECKLAALDARPPLPPARESAAPLGSGFAGCFTLDDDLALKKRISILHDDDLYCRAAYAAARERVQASEK
ncbi:MAG TPA: hypothetical protein VMT58_00445 [Candidatus Binataceae bacterium]|nr:hypothetical protein [Candidatus Binataceae bacterium]